jgi:DNA-binding ferritin-like protein (Dps family)
VEGRCRVEKTESNGYARIDILGFIQEMLKDVSWDARLRQQLHQVVRRLKLQ